MAECLIQPIGYNDPGSSTKDTGHNNTKHFTSFTSIRREKPMPKKLSFVPKKVEPSLVDTVDRQNPERPGDCLRTRNSFITDRTNHRRTVSHSIYQFQEHLSKSSELRTKKLKPLQEQEWTSSQKKLSKTGGGASVIRMQKMENWWSQKKKFGRGWIRNTDGRQVPVTMV